MNARTLVLVDGENITLRYEATLKTGRYSVAKRSNIHVPGQFIWAPDLFARKEQYEILRVSYFTTFTGDADAKGALERQISETPYSSGLAGRRGTLVPHVFKRDRNSKKNKSVDIHLTVEALRHAYNRSVDQIVLLSGDGDYTPVIQEIMRQGVKVYAGAFKSGLSPQIRPTADEFIELELFFFTPSS